MQTAVIVTFWVTVYVIILGLPRNAVGEMMPVLLATKIAMPVSMKGIVKSATCFPLGVDCQRKENVDEGNRCSANNKPATAPNVL
jgi:hypothetical protein